MTDKYITHIKSKNGWFDIDLRELLRYKDLILLFIKRDFTVKYKQTILGPAWLIINPILTVLLYTLVFGNIAGLSTGGSPQFAFYLAGNAIWSYFSACFSQTSSTFTSNAVLFGKVYFPRLTVPISTVVTNVLNLIMQVLLLAFSLIVYRFKGVDFAWDMTLIFIPILIIQVALLGLGCGIVVSSLTTKYRDLTVLVSFGVQLWMYVSPVVYSVEQIPEKFYGLYMLNPIAPIMSIWRRVFLGNGVMPYFYWGISWGTTIVVLVVGIVLFNRIEKTFMDTV